MNQPLTPVIIQVLLTTKITKKPPVRLIVPHMTYALLFLHYFNRHIKRLFSYEYHRSQGQVRVQDFYGPGYLLAQGEQRQKPPRRTLRRLEFSNARMAIEYIQRPSSALICPTRKEHFCPTIFETWKKSEGAVYWQRRSTKVIA